MHMQKFRHPWRKKFNPKKSLTLVLHQAIQLLSFRYIGYWPSMRSRWLDIIIDQVLFLCVYGLRQSQGPSTCNKRMRPISTLTEQAWLMKELSYGTKHQNMRNFPRGPKPISRQDSSILLAWEANHSTGFGSSCPLTELVKSCSTNSNIEKLKIETAPLLKITCFIIYLSVTTTNVLRHTVLKK